MEERILYIASDFFHKIAIASERRYLELSKDPKASLEEIEEAKERMDECMTRGYVAMKLYCDYLEEKIMYQESELWRLEGGCLKIVANEDTEEKFSLKELNKHLINKERCYDD